MIKHGARHQAEYYGSKVSLNAEFLLYQKRNEITRIL